MIARDPVNGRITHITHIVRCPACFALWRHDGKCWKQGNTAPTCEVCEDLLGQTWASSFTASIALQLRASMDAE